MIINCELGLARAFIDDLYKRVLINLDDKVDHFDIKVNIDDLKEIRVSVLAKVENKSQRATNLEHELWDEIRAFFGLIPFTSPWESQISGYKEVLPQVIRAIRLFRKENTQYDYYSPAGAMHVLRDKDYFAELKVWIDAKRLKVHIDGENKGFLKDDAMLMGWYLDKSINNQPNNFWQTDQLTKRNDQ